jgi:FkbM family methyltransferase
MSSAMSLVTLHKPLTRAVRFLQRIDLGYFYKFCRAYVDRHEGNNDVDITSNGELHLLRLALPHCRTVFDVGANMGEWAQLAISINANLSLHCFEPSSATYAALQARQLPPSVVLNQSALSSSSGSGTLFLFAEAAGTNSMYVRQGLEDGFGLEQRDKETIRVDTFTNYCESRSITQVDFCKIDVEGHELEVLRGMTPFLEAGRVQLIQFEYGGTNIDSGVLLKNVFDFFASFHYSLCKLFPDHLRHIKRYDQRLENFQYQNWVAMADSSLLAQDLRARVV